MSRLKSLMGVALAVAAVAPIARAADSVTIIPSFGGASTVGGTAISGVPTAVIGNTTYVYGSAQPAVYTINYSTQGSFDAGHGFGSIAFDVVGSSGVTTPATGTSYIPDSGPSSVAWFACQGAGNTTQNLDNDYGTATDLKSIVASVGPVPQGGYTSGDPRIGFAQGSPVPVGSVKVLWNGTTSNATVKFGDSTNDGLTGKISFNTNTLTPPPDGSMNGAVIGSDPLSVQFIAPILGDANLNGTVDFSDFLVLQSNFGQSGATFSQGDFDGNGTVNFNDFLLLQSHFGSTWTSSLTPASFSFGAAQPAEVVPEPTSVMLLAAGVGSLALRRKRPAK